MVKFIKKGNSLTRSLLFIAFIGGMVSFLASDSFAGAKLKIGDEKSKSFIDFGFRMQPLFISGNSSDLGGDGTVPIDSDDDGEDDRNYDLASKNDNVQKFKLRRARLRIMLKVNDLMSAFMQTEISGNDKVLIDGVAILTLHELFNVYMGQYMAPASRQNLTSSGALMAMDRPGMNYKTLSWGMRAQAGMTNTGFSESDSGVRGDYQVRDMGATLMGGITIVPQVLSFKYYGGVYNGIQNEWDGDTRDEALTSDDNEVKDKNRYTGRIQINLLDPEPKYFNSSTYLGKKKTIGIGFSYDKQDSINHDNVKGWINYEHKSYDLFIEFPITQNIAFTAEGGFSVLDLDKAKYVDGEGFISYATYDEDDTTHDLVGDRGTNWTGVQGKGYFAQAGLYVYKFQVWGLYETWNSDFKATKYENRAQDAEDTASDITSSLTDTGSYKSWRVGLTYYIQGHNANIKAGYERFIPERDNALGYNDDKIETFVLGFFTTY